jgi:colicin import membrane protein
MNSRFFRLTQWWGVCMALMLAAPVFAQVSTPELGKRAVSISSPPQAVDAKTKVRTEPDAAFMPSALKARYPKQSIISVEQANQALEDVRKGRKEIEIAFKRDEKLCYKTAFAANRCVIEAKDRRRVALADIKPIQVEADRFKRHDAVVKREQTLEKKREKNDGVGMAKSPEEKRAENEAAYEKKVRNRGAAQENVIEKRAKTERRRKKKAASAAAAAKRSGQPQQPLSSASTSASAEK